VRQLWPSWPHQNQQKVLYCLPTLIDFQPIINHGELSSTPQAKKLSSISVISFNRLMLTHTLQALSDAQRHDEAGRFSSESWWLWCHHRSILFMIATLPFIDRSNELDLDIFGCPVERIGPSPLSHHALHIGFGPQKRPCCVSVSPPRFFFPQSHRLYDYK
jgi:hypothetical protein